MFDYNKLFKPFEREGYPLEAVVSWLIATTGADSTIIDQVVSDTMLLVSQGEDFKSPEEKYPDLTISHYMEARVREIQSKLEKSKLTMLQDIEKQRIENRLKQLSTFEKEYDKMLNGNWVQQNLPTICKWFGKGKK